MRPRAQHLSHHHTIYSVPKPENKEYNHKSMSLLPYPHHPCCWEEPRYLMYI